MSHISNITYDSFVDQTGNREKFSIDPAAFEILSTVRYDPAIAKKQPKTISDVRQNHFFLFPEHVERMKYLADFFLDAMKHIDPDFSQEPFDIDQKFIFNKLVQAMGESGVSLDKPLKIRLLLSLDGTMNVELYETPVRENLLDGLDDEYDDSMRYDVYVDTTPVLASPFMSFKTTYRKVYTEARARCLPGKQSREEVVLVNTLGEVTEGSITNIAVRSKDGLWVTPQLTSGCLCGVTRYFLLKNNHIKEGSVRLESLSVGQDVLLLNGILGVVRGTIKEIK